MLQVSVGSRAACLNLGTEPGQASRISDGACGAEGKPVPDLAAVAGPSADPGDGSSDQMPAPTPTPDPTPEPVVGTIGFDGFNESYTATALRLTASSASVHSGTYSYGTVNAASAVSRSVTVTTAGGPLSFWVWRLYGSATLTVDGTNVTPSTFPNGTWQQVTTGSLAPGMHTIAYTVTGTASFPASLALDDIGPAVMSAPAAPTSTSYTVTDAGLGISAATVTNTGGDGTLTYTFTGDNGIGTKTSSSPQVTFTNAAPDTVYTFTISASNDAGTSAPGTLTVRTAPAGASSPAIGFEDPTAEAYSTAGGVRVNAVRHSGSYSLGRYTTTGGINYSVTVTTNGGPLSFWVYYSSLRTLTVDGVNVLPAKTEYNTWQQIITEPLTSGTHTIAFGSTFTAANTILIDDIGPVR